MHVIPLLAVLILAGGPLVLRLAWKALRREFGADLLAAIAIVTAVILGEYLAGALVVLMLSGGEALESFAVRRASSVLQALAHRSPSVAHRRTPSGFMDVPADAIEIGDSIVILPHEICPVDGVVLDGHGSMDESYLTGEPFIMSKAPGSDVLSGAINGPTALTVRAVRPAADSRFARIMRVMRESEQRRPRLRRLGDQLGAGYTPVAVAVAVLAWAWSGEPIRFLAVLVVATPCPLLIGIPVALIGSISLAAHRSIVIKDPRVLERIDRCRTIVLDKTGTLTYGKPEVTELITAPAVGREEVLRLAASLEQYSKHPLAAPIVRAAAREGLPLSDAAEVCEQPARGLHGVVEGRRIDVLGRKHLDAAAYVGLTAAEPAGLECFVLVDGRCVGLFRFRDEPREESRGFIGHLGPKHGFERLLLVSGDRLSEVRYLAERVGISEIYASQSPEDKVAIVEAETARAPTLFIGDGINDAPALMAASVGLAFGTNSDITAEAAGAVIMDASLLRVDEFFHIGRRMRRIALQSAVGGMALSGVAMMFAFAGFLPPVAGALVQEAIDLASVSNALRAAVPGRALSDF